MLGANGVLGMIKYATAMSEVNMLLAERDGRVW